MSVCAVLLSLLHLVRGIRPAIKAKVQEEEKEDAEATEDAGGGVCLHGELHV